MLLGADAARHVAGLQYAHLHQKAHGHAFHPVVFQGDEPLVCLRGQGQLDFHSISRYAPEL